ncbi:MAG: hypothetical protein DMG97_00660 [Acidobacteria bacterium]|nr:MAG: hypothetical protein DMG96_10165 [Acidobacteriota bacterium]PYV77924.1 MAG: hypothetical protein DMG97_00660 [Acidobacteriota bacterium]
MPDAYSRICQHIGQIAANIFNFGSADRRTIGDVKRDYVRPGCGSDLAGKLCRKLAPVGRVRN